MVNLDVMMHGDAAPKVYMMHLQNKFLSSEMTNVYQTIQSPEFH